MPDLSAPTPRPDPELEFALNLIVESLPLPYRAAQCDPEEPDARALVALAWQDIEARLAAGAEVNGACKDWRGLTVTLLSLAILHGFWDLADRLIAAGAVIDDGLGYPHCSYDAACGNAEALRFLVERGADISLFDREDMPLALATDRIASELRPGQKLPGADLLARRGTANPTSGLSPFAREQIRCFGSGYGGMKTWLEPGARGFQPTFSFDRFGRSITRLPDGRMVLIAGEHEDSYDPDFFIYNDVCVLDGNGGLDYYSYRAEDFPPTDFHSATLVGEQIWIIGCLGYVRQRQEDVTPVYRLDLKTFKISPVETSGDTPGWICRHTARLEGNTIIIEGGKRGLKMQDNAQRFALDLKTQGWRLLD